MISPRRIGVQPCELALPLRIEVLLALSRVITECPEFQAVVSPFLLSPAFAETARDGARGGAAVAGPAARAAAPRARAGRRRCRSDA